MENWVKIWLKKGVNSAINWSKIMKHCLKMNKIELNYQKKSFKIINWVKIDLNYKIISKFPLYDDHFKFHKPINSIF